MLIPERDATVRRVDLHVHTRASNAKLAGEAALRAIDCPECWSDPLDVYQQAQTRGMDFVAITDHDTLDGALELSSHKTDVLVGEELTCYFPEDQCKIHLLVYGLTPGQHQRLQESRDDIYQVASLIEEFNLAHSVAHPLYRQNDKLERWHLERLLLLFKGFEVLNGAHSAQHREGIEHVLESLCRAEIARLAELHDMRPRWSMPWLKSRTGGSDDHALLNVGRTWTEFPGSVRSVDDLLDCLRDGSCRPGGEAGGSLKLAHALYGVGLRYALERVGRDTAPAARILSTMIGRQTQPGVRGAIRQTAGRVASVITRPFARRRVDPFGQLAQLFGSSVMNRLSSHPPLRQAMRDGLPPLAEHAEIFRLLEGVNSDLINALYDLALDHCGSKNLTGVVDAVSGLVAQQLALAPYYFALFHQNKEREHLPTLTARRRAKTRDQVRVGLFTDTFDDINGVARFIRDMAEQADRAARHFTVHTSVGQPRFDTPNRVNFTPMFDRPMPLYPQLNLAIPPVLQVLEYVDRQQYDVIHISTPGPMGMVGWLAAKMLRVPTLMTYHTDFPAYIHDLTGDHRATAATTAYMRWFYRQAIGVFSRSTAYQQTLRSLGLRGERLLNILPGINTDKFNPNHADPGLLQALGADRKYTLLYTGRVSVEKNLPMLVEIFRQLCARRDDVTLIVGGDGPYREQMRQALEGLPAILPGFLTDQQMARLYGACDLFVFPSKTDTLGQVVMEAQSCGLPAIVTDEGGPKETVAHDISGVVLPAGDVHRWVDTIDKLLDDPATRARYSRSALTRSARYSLSKTFEEFFDRHVDAVLPPTDDLPVERGTPLPQPEPVLAR